MMDEKIIPVTSLLPSGKDRISFSELTNFLKCSWRYKLTYVDGLSVWTDSHFADFGTAVHAALEVFLQTKTKASVVTATYLINFFWDENPNYEKSVPRKDALQQAALICNEFYGWFEENFPGWEYVGAEELLKEVFTHKDDKHLFKGFVDCIISVPGRGDKRVYWVIDAKTSYYGWHRDKRRDESLHRQLVLYKHYWCSRENIDVKDVRTAFLILKRTGKEKQSRIDLFQISVGPKTIAKHLLVFDKALSSIKKGIAYKNRFSCDYCEYANTKHCKGYVYSEKKERYENV